MEGVDDGAAGLTVEPGRDDDDRGRRVAAVLRVGAAVPARERVGGVDAVGDVGRAPTLVVLWAIAAWRAKRMSWLAFE